MMYRPFPVRLRTIVACTALGFCALQAGAQNGYSFLNADRGLVHYSSPIPVVGRHSCAALEAFDQIGTHVITAVEIPASTDIPSHCRVRGIIQPEVQFEVLLPSAWNGRIYMHGNGGFAGQDFDLAGPRSFRLAALRHGFAAVTTDGGHDARREPLATFAHGSLQRTLDYAFRAVHVTIEAAKGLTASYYGINPAYSYFDGCSGGGRQALMAAQRFPADFDGIVAGAPLLDFSGSAVSYLWLARTLLDAPVPVTKMPAIAAAVVRKCDALDGLADGLLQDPRACDFDPIDDLKVCSGAAGNNGTDCLTEGESRTLARIYGGPRSKGKPIFFPQLPGAEQVGVTYQPPHSVRSGWSEWIEDPRGVAFTAAQLGEQFIKYLAFPIQDPNASAATFDFDHDPTRMVVGRELIDAVRTDLSAFQRRGGKLLMYFGWADTGTNPLAAIDYYEKVTARTAVKGADDFIRLYMMPGVFHCFGGYGPDRLDAMSAVIDWVEGRRAPTEIVAAQMERHNSGRIVRQRPICPFPNIARYLGRGSPSDATNFECRAP